MLVIRGISRVRSLYAIAWYRVVADSNAARGSLNTSLLPAERFRVPDQRPGSLFSATIIIEHPAVVQIGIMLGDGLAGLSAPSQRSRYTTGLPLARSLNQSLC